MSIRRLPMWMVAPALAFLAALALFGVLGASGSSVPVGSASDEGVGALNAGQSTAKRVGILQRTVRAHPRDPQVWAALGLAYYQRVRETGDFSFYTRAQGALDHAVRIDRRSVDGLVGLATIALARHDFAAGKRYALRARAAAPSSTAPYAALADARIELGEYDAAAKTLQRFVSLRPNLASYARVSYFRELHGDLAGAVSAMALAVSAGGDSPENVAYVQSLLGRLQFVRGDLTASRKAYRRALGSRPGLPLAIVGLAEVDAAAGRLQSAIKGFRRAVALLPLPLYVTQLGEAELAAGQPVQARRDFDLIGAEQRLLRANRVNSDVEIALYEAGHGSTERAIGLARRAWASAPSVRSADAVGWALTRAGRPREGLRWARRALKLGSVEPEYLYHAGVAAKGAGERALARMWLRRALADNPRFSPLHGPRAQRLLRSLR